MSVFASTRSRSTCSLSSCGLYFWVFFAHASTYITHAVAIDEHEKESERLKVALMNLDDSKSTPAALMGLLRRTVRTDVADYRLISVIVVLGFLLLALLFFPFVIWALKTRRTQRILSKDFDRQIAETSESYVQYKYQNGEWVIRTANQRNSGVHSALILPKDKRRIQKAPPPLPLLQAAEKSKKEVPKLEVIPVKMPGPAFSKPGTDITAPDIEVLNPKVMQDLASMGYTWWTYPAGPRTDLAISRITDVEKGPIVVKAIDLTPPTPSTICSTDCEDVSDTASSILSPPLPNRNQSQRSRFNHRRRSSGSSISSAQRLAYRYSVAKTLETTDAHSLAPLSPILEREVPLTPPPSSLNFTGNHAITTDEVTSPQSPEDEVKLIFTSTLTPFEPIPPPPPPSPIRDSEIFASILEDGRIKVRMSPQNMQPPKLSSPAGSIRSMNSMKSAKSSRSSRNSMTRSVPTKTV